MNEKPAALYACCNLHGMQKTEVQGELRIADAIRKENHG